MSSSKSGKQESQVSLPPELANAAKSNLASADIIGRMPTMNNFGPTVAAAAPGQLAAMAGANQASSAFGTPFSSSTGLPDAISTPGGYSGYSTKNLYDAAMGGLTDFQRQQLQLFQNKPQTQGAPAASPAVGTGAGATSGKGGILTALADKNSPDYQRMNNLFK